MRKFFFSLASALLLAGSMSATDISYVNMDKTNKNGGFRAGSSTKQGQAIRISKAKLQHLIGKTIESVTIVPATKNTNDGQIHPFITTSLEGDPICKADLKIVGALKANTWTLSEPYTITGEEENLYIGYTVDVKTTYKPLLGDMTNNIKGCSYAFQDSVWVDSYEFGKGSAMISFNTKEDVEPYSDAIINNLSYNKYYKAGTKYNFTSKFANVGTKAITSFETEVKVGDKVFTEKYENVNIPAKSTYNFALPTIDYDNDGYVSVDISLKNINGNNDDIDESDNVDNGTMFLYPSYMERSILLEGFTGQDCTGCPSGHYAINSALAATKQDVVEVMHHSGYYPDIFTMEEDALYTMYYGNGQTYAPGVMANRTTDYSIATQPVVNASVNYISNIIDNAATYKPYVSLDLQTKLNEETRELIVSLNVKANEELPSKNVLYNVFLVQGGVKAYQASGGTNYNHTRVFRGSLINNAWGVVLPEIAAGESKTVWTDTITIPEKIHSSYWTEDMKKTIDGHEYYVDNRSATSTKKILTTQSEIEAVLSDMSVVAFVSEYNTTDFNKNQVFNCVEAKLGESHMQWGYDYTAGVENVEVKPNVDIYVRNGKVGVSGEYDKLYVYSITGKQMDASATLTKGAYIVKVVAGGKQMAKKIMVR